MKKSNQNPIDEAIALLDNIVRASAPDHFEKQVLKKVSFLPQKKFAKWIQLAVAAMITFAIINLATVLYLQSLEPVQEDTISYYIDYDFENYE
ncbi:MAG: hypothetical protein JXQ90_23485 [Cyclobacteriaceae bacterium]